MPSAPCTDGGGTRSECRDTDSEAGLRDALDQEDGANASDGWVPLQARWKRPERCGQEDMEPHTSPRGKGLACFKLGSTEVCCRRNYLVPQNEIFREDEIGKVNGHGGRRTFSRTR